MKTILLNFQRSGVDSLIQTLGLESTEEILEIKINDSFSDEVYQVLKELEYLNSSAGGGAFSGY